MSRLDADDGELAARFRSLDEAARRRLACSMVRLALNELDARLFSTTLSSPAAPTTR